MSQQHFDFWVRVFWFVTLIVAVYMWLGFWASLAANAGVQVLALVGKDIRNGVSW